VLAAAAAMAAARAAAAVSWRGLGRVAGTPPPPEAIAPSLRRCAARGRPGMAAGWAALF